MSRCLREGSLLCSFPNHISGRLACRFPVIFLVTLLLIFQDHNLCLSQSRWLCPHPSHLPFHTPSHLSGHILSQYPFPLSLHMPCHHPIRRLCHFLPGDATALWLAYGHSRSTIVYAHTLPWVFRLPAVAGT